MYGGGESSGNTNSRNVTNKETLHISPHIAAHKSSSSSHSNGQASVVTSQDQENQSSSRLAPIQTITSHVPGYRVGIPTSSMFTESFQHTVRSQTGHIQVPTIFTLPHSKALPQDLSAHTNKLSIPESESVSEQKPLPHIHTVGSQNLDNLTGPLIVPVSDRSTYYRLADGTTISISSQHQGVLVSQPNDDHSAVHHSQIETSRLGHNDVNHSVSTSSTSVSMSMSPLSGHVSSPQHGGLGSLSEGPLFLVPHEISVPTSSFLQASESILPSREIMRSSQVDIIKEESADHKDLVRQALQAAAVQNSHKANANQDVIEYSYGADEMGSDDCLVHDDMICHSTFCPQPNVKPQELLLMNLSNVGAGQQSSNKLSNTMVVGANLGDGSNSGQVMVLDPASTLDESGNLLPSLSTRRRRSRLSEEAQLMRRVKIAHRMREKRANETEEQKEKRRLREAERMRKKRAQEDETSKQRRRREAAERARRRRENLSKEEREIERKKAAERMRLRRQNENEEQKRQRRIKAAERMRRRRSMETPEERAARKQNIAMRMKEKRQRKEEKEEKVELDSSSLDSFAIAAEEDKRLVTRDLVPSSKDPLFVPEANGQFTSTGHLMVSSSLGGNIALLQNETPSSIGSHMLQGTILSAVEISHIPQSVSLQLRNTSPSRSQRESPEDAGERSSTPIHKSVVVTQGLTPSSQTDDDPQQVSTSSRTSDSSTLVLSKSSLSSSSPSGSSHLSAHHHLPHLLHNLTPHQDQHHHQSYILPHSTPHSHSQAQPVQLRHQ